MCIRDRANFVLNITSKWLKFNTAPSYPFEDFALFGQFHSEKFNVNNPSDPGGVPVSGVDDFVMANVGLSADSIDPYKPTFGDLLISYSNLDAQSQSNSRREGYFETFPLPSGPAGI